jgi:hypothetical protein
MFIRKRFSSNTRFWGERYSYQIIETYRDAGKVKQRVLANLGASPTIAEALEWERDCIRRTQNMGWLGPVTPERRSEAMRLRAEAIADSEAQIARLESLLPRFKNVVSQKTPSGIS